jgi:hypothetical protein
LLAWPRLSLPCYSHSVRILCLDFLPGLVFGWYLCCTALHCLSALLCFIKQGSAHCVPFSSISTNACLCLSSPSRLSCTYTSIHRASHFHSHSHSRSPFVAGLKLPSTTASSFFSASPHSLHRRQNQTQRQAKAREPKQRNLELHTSATYQLQAASTAILNSTTSVCHQTIQRQHFPRVGLPFASQLILLDNDTDTDLTFSAPAFPPLSHRTRAHPPANRALPLSTACISP